MKANTALKWQLRIASFTLASATTTFISAVVLGSLSQMLVYGALLVFWEWVFRRALYDWKKLEQMLEAKTPHA